MTDPTPDGLPRVFSPTDLLMTFRAVAGLSAHERAFGERAAGYRRGLPAQVTSLDVGPWLAWCLAGLPLFSEGLPTLVRVRQEGCRVVMVAAMLRAQGNITRAAATLGTSRKAVRDSLRLAGLYPWVRETDPQGPPDLR